ncbi:ribosome-associated ATPase/putative transporter RbbA [Aquabacterium parvum]|uniref:ribosome-associated ATPase/putative transporter RbbA n=1 Tax=Aquabacterium parvum TaxID=70584 RepID=UPI000718E985|nr:ribosome-associated ATPase/putative transporter RbbA [Aquabacterium parvum]MBU0917056.1 ribosome-associated ATPase/putative transporter RbbA [Gammaproteobacteria bacterium]
MSHPSEIAIAVDVRDLGHRYGDTRALEHVSLQLPAGRTIALVGPDGVGKSTLLSLIAGVKVIQHGRVHVLGEDLSSASARARLSPRVAFMPQGLGRNLYPTLSVAENIDFFARLFGQGAAEREARIQRLLDATGLAPFRDRPAGKLSGGMKQKLGLCCSLVHDPDLLILDEPTTGVDPLSRRQFWALVEALRAERPGMTVIVATAYMEEAERFEHLVAMNAGQVLVFDRTENVLARTPQHTLEAAYIELLPEDARGSSEPLIIPPRPAADGPPAIEAQGLTRRFGDFIAVDNVSFRIERGEIFGFLGSNGCGKTTTMKMLTGLLDISSGSAQLLGAPIDPRNLETRMKVGYMSQAFSLYDELSVRQNLVLHARLYRMEGDVAEHAIGDALQRFDLSEHAEARPSELSLGIRQRLQLAAACLHKPEVLILDEPTSGVDPAARDLFWRQLVQLSRQEQVTIFVSTHFMNEAERCDRISLMHRGRVLAVGSPQALQQAQGATSLEDAFVAHLQAADTTVQAAQMAATARTPAAPAQNTLAASHAPGPTSLHAQDAADTLRSSVRAMRERTLLDWWARTWAFARREAMELKRDPIRLTFALLGPIILLVTAAWSISFDIQKASFTVLDRDQTHDSRQLVEHFEGSRYFQRKGSVQTIEDGDALLRAHEVVLVIEIPPGFGRDLVQGRRPDVALYIDGAQTFTAENVRGYARGILLEHAMRFAQETPGLKVPTLPARLEPRFSYNQAFRSIYASTPGLLMLCLIIIPAMLTALGVVREKEMGSILNLYASPASVGQFLVGKQLPYICLAMLSYLSLVFLTIVVLQVPLKGNFFALSLGALCFVFATTALGLLISAFLKSQVAATFATAIVCLIPSINFSGLLYPVSTLTGAALWVGQGFPASWFQLISLGSFTKGLSFDSFGPMYAALLAFGLGYLALARLAVRKQEA